MILWCLNYELVDKFIDGKDKIKAVIRELTETKLKQLLGIASQLFEPKRAVVLLMCDRNLECSLDSF